MVNTLYAKVLGKLEDRLNDLDPRPEPASAAVGNERIRALLGSPAPFFVGRLGTTENNTLSWYCRFNRPFHLPFTKALQEGVWNAAGFFPPTSANMGRLGALFWEALELTDLYASWNLTLDGYLFKGPLRGKSFVRLESLEAHTFDQPWTEGLAGKRVLVIHPFARTIAENYRNKRRFLFNNPAVLPDFQLTTIKAHQTLGHNTAGFASWFDAFDDLKSKIDRTEFDVALVAAGTYGMPLCSHIRKMGKQVIYVGGVLQVLFGVKGGRWDQVSGLYNEHWCAPDEQERPENWKTVENGCYW